MPDCLGFGQVDAREHGDMAQGMHTLNLREQSLPTADVGVLRSSNWHTESMAVNVSSAPEVQIERAPRAHTLVHPHAHAHAHLPPHTQQDAAGTNPSQVASKSQIRTSLLFFKMVPKNRDLRCVLHPASLGAGGKTRLEAGLKKFKTSLDL